MTAYDNIFTSHLPLDRGQVSRAVNKGRTPKLPVFVFKYNGYKAISQFLFFLDKMSENSRTGGRGRGTSTTNFPPDQCLCNRPRNYVLCRACGYYTRGRVRYFCPVHPKTIFLCDINQCPHCKAPDFMMTDFLA